MEVITVTYNPCVDITQWVDDFDTAVLYTEKQTGGKGVNCARVLGNLGIDAIAVCPVGGDTGLGFLELASMEKINIRPTKTKNATRVITTTVRKRDHAQRVDYQKGSPLSDEEIAAIEDAAIDACKEGAKILSINGSVPDEKSAMSVKSLIEKAKNLGVKTVLDSNGIGLIEGIKALPDLIKPNEDELFCLTGEKDVSKAAGILINRGIGTVLASLGEKGCMLATYGMEQYCPACKVETVNAVGSGDSFLAAFLWASLKGYSLEGACAVANAAGAANAKIFPAARITMDDIKAIMPIL